MTIRQLAIHLGLSKTTVADALRGSSVVKLETREWVQKKAWELGYRPNPVAAAFLQQVRSKRCKRYRANLALLLPWVRNSSISTLGPTARAFYEGAAQRAEKLGYSLDVIDPKEYSSQTLTKVLLARGILGVAIGPRDRPMGHLSLDWSKFAAVAFGYSMTRPLLHRVVHNHFDSVKKVFRICQRKGYKRIGLALRAESEKRSNGLWSAGFWELQRTLKPSEQVDPFLVLDDNYKPEAIRKWIRRQKPDCVIFHTSLLVPELPEISTEPGGILPVLLDYQPKDRYPGMDQRFADHGSRLVDELSSQILHNERGVPESPCVTMVEGVWVDQPASTLA